MPLTARSLAVFLQLYDLGDVAAFLFACFPSGMAGSFAHDIVPSAATRSPMGNAMRHGVVALALLALWGSTARADAVTDCNQDKDVDRAIRGCTALIRQNPTNSPAFFLRAGRHMDKGDFYNAIADYNKVLGFNPKDASMYQSRGVAHLANGNFDKAIEDYTRAIELNPDDPIRYLAYAGRGRAYEDKGQKDRAIEDFRRALSMQPDSQDAKDGLRRLGASP